MIEIYAVNCKNRLQGHLFYDLLSKTDKNKQQRIGGFTRHEDAVRTLVSDILIRFIIGKKLRLKNNEISFGYNPMGKPYLIGYERFHFNISHSGEWVVCAIDCKTVGIDIERILPIDISISKKYFSTIENKMLESKSSDERLSYFYEIWTLKESFMKACGVGMQMPLWSFSTIDQHGQMISTLNHNSDIYFFKQLMLNSDYTLSVCAMNNVFSNELEIVDCAEFVEIC